MSKEIISYRKLQSELNEIVDKLQDSTVDDVDNAIKLYERAREIISQMEVYLATAENKILIVSKK